MLIPEILPDTEVMFTLTSSVNSREKLFLKSSITLFTTFNVHKARFIWPVAEIHVLRSSIRLETVTILGESKDSNNKT